MDMDLVVTFAFVATIVLIITAGIVIFPIARKLGHFLEEAARERAEARLSGGSPNLLEDAAELRRTLARLEEQLDRIADRQAFVERLMEERPADRALEASRHAE